MTTTIKLINAHTNHTPHYYLCMHVGVVGALRHARGEDI